MRIGLLSNRSLIVFTLLFTINGIVSQVHAQPRSDSLLQQRLDSLQQLPQADTALFSAYYQLTLFHLRQDSAKAAQYAHHALNLADSLDNQVGQGIGKMSLGLHQIMQGNYLPGLRNSFEAEQLFKDSNRNDYLSILYSYIGIGYNRLGNDNEALKYYLRSDSLMKINGTPMQQAQIKANIGIIYSSQGHHRETIRYLKDAEAIIRQQGNPGQKALLDHNIGVAYRHLSQYDSALVYLEKALDQRQAINDRFGMASTYQNLGRIYIDEEQYEYALNYIEAAIRLQEEIGDKVNISATYLYAGRIFYNLNDFQKALTFGKKSLETSQRTGQLEHQAQALQFLSTVEESQSDLTSALSYLRQYSTLQDSLNKQNRVEAFEEMRVRYESEEMEQQIELLQNEQRLRQSELDRAKVMRNSLIGGTLALLIILGLLYARYRSGKKHENQLQEKNKKLEELSEEKSEYLDIAAHDLKNPLTSILGFSELLMDPDTSDEEVQSHAKFIHISAFRMLDLIKQFLDVNAIESGNKMATTSSVNLYPAMQNVIEHYEYRAGWKNISLEINLHAKKLHAIADPPIFQEVMENIISNAVKYSDKGSTVWIRSFENDHSLRIEVEDEGPGLSEEEQQQLFNKFKRLSPNPTEGEGSTGLGLYIVKKMMDAMDGKIWCESTLGKGSTFIVELPLPKDVEVELGHD